jgi:hypothetical protein
MVTGRSHRRDSGELSPTDARPIRGDSRAYSSMFGGPTSSAPLRYQPSPQGLRLESERRPNSPLRWK